MKASRDTIRLVLQKRAAILEHIVRDGKDDQQYYLGKLHGYQQAIDLLGESEESAAVEL